MAPAVVPVPPVVGQAQAVAPAVVQVAVPLVVVLLQVGRVLHLAARVGLPGEVAVRPEGPRSLTRVE